MTYGFVRHVTLTLTLSAAPGLAAPSLAQDARGTITGTVIDSSNALVPGATVVVTNTAMGTEVTTATNADGFFQATYLLPGTYRVTVELAGFKKLVREGIALRSTTACSSSSRSTSAAPWRK